MMYFLCSFFTSFFTAYIEKVFFMVLLFYILFLVRLVGGGSFVGCLVSFVYIIERTHANNKIF